MTQPITEASNPITDDIDVASPEEIVSLLEKCDQEVFDGFRDYKSLFHPDSIKTIENVAVSIQEILQHPDDGLVVFSGCGTSGRLGFIVARTFNEYLSKEGKQPVFQYLMAGGDKALFTSQEANEDDPHNGHQTLKEVSTNKTNVVYIGITCGLSAPYVAGQLDYCMDNLDVFTHVLLGFNPTHLARNTKIETWDKTFLTVVDRMKSLMKKDNRCYILNPVVGPEPITGSSRMKGGTATKLLLETVCMKAFTEALHPNRQWPVTNYLKTYLLVSQAVYSQKEQIGRIVKMAGNRPVTNYLKTYQLVSQAVYSQKEQIGRIVKMAGNRPVTNYLKTYQLVSQAVYSQKEQIGRIVKMAGNSLSEGGNIYYLGTDSLALMGLIDSSECPPTYGATLDDVRGFVKDGYETLRNKEGDLTDIDKHFRISLEDFARDIVLTEKDTVIVLNTDVESSAQEKLATSKCRKVLVIIDKGSQKGYDEVICIDLPTNNMSALTDADTVELSNQMYREIAVKWCLNAVTTGAHILKGKVYKNIMIDVKVSNNKLFHRAAGILQKLGNLSVEDSTEYLLRSIYDTDDVTSELKNAPVGKHIAEATPKDKVVPVALVSAVLKCSITEAKTKLAEDRIIRRSIANALSNLNTS